MVSAITKDGSKIYVALNDQELADLQRGETLIVPGNLLELPYVIAVVSAGVAPTELEEVAPLCVNDSETPTPLGITVEEEGGEVIKHGEAQDDAHPSEGGPAHA